MEVNILVGGGFRIFDIVIKHDRFKDLGRFFSGGDTSLRGEFGILHRGYSIG